MAKDNENDVVLDALVRVRRLLSDCVRMELSPAAWTQLNTDTLEIELQHELQDIGPVWKGLPGEHPLLQFVDRAITKLKNESIT